MADFAEILWTTPTDEEIDATLDKLAKDIVDRGLQTPAILMLETHKPLAGFLRHASVVFAPLALPMVGFDRYTDLSRVMTRRENVESLIRRIETLSSTSTES